MITVYLKRAIGSYPQGALLQFSSAASTDGQPGDIVLCSIDDATLLPHVILPTGELAPYCYIIGERKNIRYCVVRESCQGEPV
jgi:hypothetical protein